VFVQHLSPSRESDLPGLLARATTMAMEKGVLKVMPSALMVRSGPIFGAHEKRSVISRWLPFIGSAQLPAIACEGMLSPTYLPDLVSASLDLLIDGASGLWHLANSGQRTWSQVAWELAALWGQDHPWAAEWDHLLSTKTANARSGVLGTERGQILPAFEDAIHRYAKIAKES